ncbi:pyridoxamine 5'-phosphate oxidase family protein [Oxalobacteraceae bacterium]|nr:pyridoxamine 5'-phosphate oxidase family protein [Oxalobacteraceae bacterium]
MDAPFHKGELEAQRLAGKGSSGGAIRDYMPDQHREFFAMLPFMLVSTVDAQGWPHADVLSGAPGFVSSPDPETLELTLPAPLEAAMQAPAAGADLRATFAPGTRIGMLGLDFGTRRRNRANGVVQASLPGRLRIAVEESFGNCPKYIHLRDVRPEPVQLSVAEPVVFEGLGADARALVEQADTFFVATTGGEHGSDISHRGGPAGFVHIDGDTLTVPDFSGNRYYNTFGNMVLDDRSALLFIDYRSGDLLYLRGRVQVLWDADTSAFPGAERLWRFVVERGSLRRGALPLRWDERLGGRSLLT